eukprot:421684_1
MLCDGTNDCYLNDDESQCDVCIESTLTTYDYFTDHYFYIAFEEQYKGSVYYSINSQFFIYPSTYSINGMYVYDYNILNTTHLLAYCIIDIKQQPLEYFTMRVGSCQPWYYLQTVSNHSVKTNITAEYCTVTDYSTPSPITKASNVSFIIPEWIDNSAENVTFYVASNGHDLNHCGLAHSPCGTLQITTQYGIFVSNSIESIRNIIIIIRGQNRDQILYANKQLQRNLCFPRIKPNLGKVQFDKIVFNFDPMYISSLNDWFPTIPSQELCNYKPKLSENGFFQTQDAFFQIWPTETDEAINWDVISFTVLINNLIINEWNVNSINTKPNFIVVNKQRGGYINVKYIFQNFTFKNNNIMYGSVFVLNAPQIEVYNSTFDNNIINIPYGSLFSNEVDPFLLPDSKYTSFIMKHCTVNNMTLLQSTSFVDITQKVNQAQLRVLIVDNIFSNIHLVDDSLIINIFGESEIRSNNIVIKNIQAHNVDGTIINIGNVHYGLFVIDAINVSTSKMNKILHANDEALYTLDSLFLITAQNSAFNISNVTINYLISTQLVNHCWVSTYNIGRCWSLSPQSAFNMSDNIAEAAFQRITAGIQYYCDTPMLFIKIVSDNLDNKVQISSITIRNDLTTDSLYASKKQLFHKNTFLCTLSEETPAKLYYDSSANPIDAYDFLDGIIQYGFITIDNCYLYLHTLELHGIGHSNVILIQKGVKGYDYVEATNIITYVETSIYDPYALQTNMFAINLGDGTMIISNSTVSNIQSIAFRFVSGDNRIISTHISYSLIAILSTLSTRSVYLYNCYIQNVGLEHVATKTVLEAMQLLTEQIINQQYHPPLIFSAQFTWIENCIFSTDSNGGIASFSSSYPYYEESDTKHTVVLLNNTINRTDDGFLYNFSKSKPYPITIWKGIINFVGNFETFIIGNIMLDTVNKSLFYFNTPLSICFNGNTFQGSTIVDINTGTISSCFRSDIINIFEEKHKCFYGSLSKRNYIENSIGFNFSFAESNFQSNWISINANQPIIKTENYVKVMLENITFISKNISKHQIDIIHMNTGTFIFIDIILSGSLTFPSFVYNPANCYIKCYDVLQNYRDQYDKYISQLQVKCISNYNKSQNVLQYLPSSRVSFVNHTTAYFIYFTYITQYKVDSNFNLSFYISDQFGNIFTDY